MTFNFNDMLLSSLWCMKLCLLSTLLWCRNGIKSKVILFMVDFLKFMTLRSQMMSKLWTLWIHVQWLFYKNFQMLFFLMVSVMSTGIEFVFFCFFVLISQDCACICLCDNILCTTSSFVLKKDSQFCQRKARYTLGIF